jgi:hypothetical protein
MIFMNWVKKICSAPKALLAIHRLEEAWDLSANHKDNEAEVLFEKGELLLKTLPIEYQFIKGYIKFRLEKRVECLKIFNQVLQDLDNSKKFNKQEKLYLIAFISPILKIYNTFSIGDIDLDRLVNLEQVKLEHVAPWIIRKFPLHSVN